MKLNHLNNNHIKNNKEVISVGVVKPINKDTVPAGEYEQMRVDNSVTQAKLNLPYKRRWTLASTDSHMEATFYGFDRDSGTVYLITPEAELVRVAIAALQPDQRAHVGSNQIRLATDSRRIADPQPGTPPSEVGNQEPRAAADCGPQRSASAVGCGSDLPLVRFG